MTRTLWAAGAAALLLAGPALAAMPGARCASDKNNEAGKYAKCRQKAEAKFVLTGDAGARTALLQMCSDRYGVMWRVIEDNAGGACPSTGDQTTIQQYVDTTMTDVAAALAGEPLAGQAQTLKTTVTECWNGSGQLIPCAGTGQDGEFQKGLDRAYVDNGDGTITDMQTGLMWEKLSRDSTIHDKENKYTWPDAINIKVRGLNALAFAGYTDWRLPNINELYSLVKIGPYSPAISSPAFHWNCITGCTVLNCSCTYTESAMYWTSTTEADYPGRAAWLVVFHDGSTTRRANTDGTYHVRAVRGGY